ncbi:hypothetical protein C100_02730 [Sphingobium sp. C100]|uniref:hypothetical protein n=1 Tax=Sphingobium sp. C100 TaxID=1207055 RepID=UPI0003D62AAE|nr:hypothetical protein [Sphingobium sp. C100]ETI65330.1 hypothetical protein C100_02730 [Sphingobium sp. C100]
MIAKHGIATGLLTLATWVAPAQADTPTDAPERAVWKIRAAMTDTGLANLRAVSTAQRLTPLATILSSSDRRGLAEVAHRFTSVTTGPVDFTLSADRARNGPRGKDLPLGMDRWSLRNVGLDARIGLWDQLTLVAAADYGRMKRRLDVMDVTPRRLSTTMARVGMALLFGDGPRLSLDYLSVSRPSQQGGIVRLAQALGGAPLTGHGPELSLRSRQGDTRGGLGWRISLSSTMRPEKDLGLESDAMRHDMRATSGFSLKL